MSYNEMTNGEMVDQLKRLISPQAEEGVRELMEGDSTCAIYVPHAQALYDDMGQYQVRLSAMEPEIKQLTQELGVDDAGADSVLGAVRGVCQHGRALLADPSGLDAVSEVMFGDGRYAQLINATYSGVGGEAALMRKRLKPEHWATLESIKLDTITLKDAVEDWMRRAEAIAAKEARRQRLGAQLDDAISRKQVQQLRHRWIRLMRAIEGAVGMSGHDERTQGIILAPLQQAAESAGKRGK